MNFQSFHLPLGLVFAYGLAVPLLPQTAPAPAPKCPVSTGHIVVAQGTYSPQPDVTFLLRHFAATLIPQGKSAPLCFQKVTAVSHAVIFASSESLTRIFAQKLTDSGSKIRDLQIVNSAEGVTLKGVMTKVDPVHFSIFGPVTTDGTALLMHAEKIDADGIPVKALLAMVGEHLSSVLGMRGVTGVSVEENTISFFPEQIAHLRGHLEKVTTSAEGLTLTYAQAGRLPGLHRSAAR